MYFLCQEHIADREASVHARKTLNLFLDFFFGEIFFLEKSSLFLGVFSLKCRLTRATAGMSCFALIVYVFSRAWKCDKLQPRPCKGGSRCNDNLVRQGSSLRNWGRWGRPLQRVWCEGFLIRQWCLVPVWRLPKPYWSMHFRDVSERNGHSDHACDLKRKGLPENEGLGNYDLMDEGNDVVIIKLEVVSRKGPNSWSLNILVRGSADTSIWNFLAPGLWVSD